MAGERDARRIFVRGGLPSGFEKRLFEISNAMLDPALDFPMLRTWSERVPPHVFVECFRRTALPYPPVAFPRLVKKRRG